MVNKKGAGAEPGAGAAIRNFGSGSGSLFNFGSRLLAPAPQHWYTETHIKRQATRHDGLSGLLGGGNK
jgi:hypothetical protein